MGHTQISAKCITYGRVSFLEEAIESFLRQDYKGDKELVIVNDCPFQKLYYNHPDINIINVPKVFNTIGDKENFAIENCKYNTIAVWDDDDIALSHHLKNIDEFMQDNDLLHWERGIAMVSHQIRAIGAIGNSGIVYTKDIWERVGKHDAENAGYDMSFVLKIRGAGGKIINAKPIIPSWIYNWGNGSYHMSGLGKDTPDRENVIIRHSKHIEKLKNKGLIPVGNVLLNPHWNYNYEKILKNYKND